MPLYQSPEEKQKSKLTGHAAISELFSSSASHGKKVKSPRMIPRTNPLLKTKVKMVEALTKAHQMEGDGLLLLLYFQLFKKTWNSRKEFQSCPGARCPDTVVYEHNFPQHWYTYDNKHGELLKRPGSFLDTAQILKYFSRPVSKDSDIVAQYLCSHENPDTEELETSVEFFTQSSLKDFLHNRKNRPDGVLQRFITPKGEHNFQIQAVWSPKVTLVYKRTNNYRMKDKTVGVYVRAVTCDGPPHFSREDLLAEKTREEVVKICQNFVQHFNSTEHKPVSRVVLYFKVDEKDNIWIMWASSLRIGTSKFSSSHQRIPLNLSTKFTTPDAEQKRRRENVEGEELERKLLSKDVEQYRLSSDFMFATTFCRELSEKTRPYTAKKRNNLIEHNLTYQPSPPKQPLLLMDRRPRTADRPASPPVRTKYFVTSDRPPFLPSPRLNSVPPPWSPTNPFHRQVLRLGLEGCSTPQKLNNQNNDRRDNIKKIEDLNNQLSQQEQSDWEAGWWCATEKSEREYRELLQNEELIRSWGNDQLYHIYSHTLNHGMQKPYLLQPPKDIWQILCSGDHTRYAEEVMSALGLKEHDSDDIDSDSFVPTFYFCGYGCSAHINSNGSNIISPENEIQNRPMAQIARDLDAAVTTIFNELKTELQQWTIAIKKQQKGVISNNQLPCITTDSIN